MTIDLYTPKEVQNIRELLIKEQQGKCALSNQTFQPKDFHLDHRHDEDQYVRAALYKQANTCLGRIENLWTRYLSYWYNGTLSSFLRDCSEYLKREEDTRYRHPGWIAKIKTEMNKLNTKQQDLLLESFGYPPGKNQKERKQQFGKLVMDRNLGYNTICDMIRIIKEGKETI